MGTEKYFVCLDNVKSVDIACDKEDCSLELSYYNNDTTTWKSKSNRANGKKEYERAYKIIVDGLRNGEKFVEIDFSDHYDR